MTTEPFVITAPATLDMKGATLIAELKRFEVSEANVLGLDLSALSVLYSAQIGILIGGIKSAKKKNGAAVILVTNEMLYKLLTSLNLHRSADIVRDAESFQKAIRAKSGDAGSAAQPAGIANSPPIAVSGPVVPPPGQGAAFNAAPTPAPRAAAVPPPSAPPPKQNLGAVITIIVLLFFIIVAAAGVGIVLVQKQGMQTTLQNQATIIGLLQSKVDSLNVVIGELQGSVNRYKEDLALLQDELSDAPVSTEPQGKKP